jgi:hypothetical protein
MTAIGLFLSEGLTCCSTEAKKAFISTCIIVLLFDMVLEISEVIGGFTLLSNIVALLHRA